MSSILTGRRILIIESDYLIALAIANDVRRAGGDIRGPAANLGTTRTFLADPLDGAILDLGLGNQFVYSIADDLLAAGVPIVFSSDGGQYQVPRRFLQLPLHTKPLDMIKVAADLVPRNA